MDVLARYESLVDDVKAFRDACARPLPYVVRVNTIRATPDRALAALDEAGIGWERRAWNDRLIELDTESPGNTWPYYLGWLHGQEEVSALPVSILEPSPGDRVFDACAAPGSKTSQLAAAMEDEGLLVANDVNLGRLAALRSNLDRLGVTCAAVTNRDARSYSMAPVDPDVDAFDAAIVDAPCSGEGTIRKNPDALDGWSEAYLEDASAVQSDILRRAVEVTRPGGTVIYSTCTFAPEENEAVLDAVLGDRDCSLVDFETPIPASPGVTEWRGRHFDPSVRLARRVWPHLSDTGGFFIAKLEVGA